jgi:hypothetical protein
MRFEEKTRGKQNAHAIASEPTFFVADAKTECFALGADRAVHRKHMLRVRKGLCPFLL